MFILFHPSSPGYGYFSSLFQELQQDGGLTFVGEADVKLSHGNYQVVAEDILKHVQILSSKFFDVCVGENDDELGKDNTFRGSNVVNSSAVFMKTLVALFPAEYLMTKTLFASQFVASMILPSSSNNTSKGNCFLYCCRNGSFDKEENQFAVEEYILQIESSLLLVSSTKSMFHKIEEFQMRSMWYNVNSNVPKVSSVHLSLTLFRTIFVPTNHKHHPPDDTSSAKKERDKMKGNGVSSASDCNMAVNNDDGDSTIITTTTDCSSYINFDHYYYSCNSCGSLDVSCRCKDHLSTKEFFDKFKKTKKQSRRSIDDGPFTTSSKPLSDGSFFTTSSKPLSDGPFTTSKQL
jgi:hypothetical protein